MVQSIMDGWRNMKTKLTVAIVFFLVGPLLILAQQLFRVPEEGFPVYTNTSFDESLASYPVQECEVERFPPRHWTRQSKYSPVNPNARHPGKQIYGTLEAQQAIWSHQHPVSCHDKQFLIYEAVGEGHGIGSTIHVASVALLVALNLNRIIVLMPQPNFEWVKGKYCEGMDTMDECYFEPLSSCTINDVFGSMEVSRENLGKFLELDVGTYRNSSERVLRTAVWKFAEGVVPFLNRETPIMFHNLLDSGRISKGSYYWWRAQSSAYFIRPTLRTLRELDQRRGAVFRGRAIEPGTISVHVRHGDKWIESKLADDATFLRNAELLIEKYPAGLQRRIFLSTEDPQTVRFFASLRNWKVEYTNVSRDAYKDPKVSPQEFASRIGWDEEFLNSLLSLQLAIECEGFVGAISSNWNRLIDELRSTVRCKYDRVYVDVDQGFHVTDYNW